MGAPQDEFKITKFDEWKIQSLLKDAGIIRNNLKIRGTIANARAYLKIKNNSEFKSFVDYIWSVHVMKPLVYQQIFP